MKIHEIASHAILEGILSPLQVDQIRQLVRAQNYDAADEIALRLLMDSIRDHSVACAEEALNCLVPTLHCFKISF